MLDIHFIRENADIVKAGAAKKHIEVDIDKLIAVDDERKLLRQELDAKRAEQNRRSNEIRTYKDKEREMAIEEMQHLKAGMAESEERLKTVMSEWQKLMLTVPNIPDMSVPDGESDADNLEIKKWPAPNGLSREESMEADGGTPTTFDFQPKDHVELMAALGIADFERGAKVAGFRGYFLKGDGVFLANAVWQLALKHFSAKGFTPMSVPSLLRREAFLGTGYLPQGEEDLYKTQDGEYLSGTGEVATMGYHMNEILDIKEFPIKYLSFSPCFRREAGAHGKDVRGLIRVHEFFKWEQVVLCKAEHDESVRIHEWLNRNTEEFIELLNIPYRTVVNCGGDLGLGQVKKYDIELWVPAENTYREIGSSSYFHDFQTRRLNIRYRDAEGNMRFPHSLNSTAIPTPRILVSIIENYQQADGTIKVPEALQPYVGKAIIGGAR
jgi:seryl-tRNA synthetase